MEGSITRKVLNTMALIGMVSARVPPSICMLSPLPTIAAGDSITASVDNPQGRPCAATLAFSDEDFLAVTFALPPVTCLGFQQASIDIPIEVPNGVVTILWECADDQSVSSCTRAVIEGGTGDINALVPQQQGKMGCVGPTATVTTFSTFIQGSSTSVATIVDTLSGTVTNIPSSVAESTTTQTQDSATTGKTTATTGTPESAATGKATVTTETRDSIATSSPTAPWAHGEVLKVEVPNTDCACSNSTL